MRPKKPETTGEGDLFRARLDQIINLKHELVQLGGTIDWDWIDREIAPLYSEKGRPGIASRFVIGLLLLKQIYGLSDEDVCERWVYDPYFQDFTGFEFFQHEFPQLHLHWLKLQILSRVQSRNADIALVAPWASSVACDRRRHLWLSKAR